MPHRGAIHKWTLEIASEVRKSELALERLLKEVRAGDFIEIVRVEQNTRVSVSALKFTGEESDIYARNMKSLLSDECEALRAGQTLHLRITRN